MRTTLALSLFMVAAAGAAHASSDDAWAEFAADVKAKCIEAAKPSFKTGNVAVDPFGSESFGLAVVSGELKSTKGQQAAVICVYDKKTKKVEIGSELGSDVIKVTVPKKK